MRREGVRASRRRMRFTCGDGRDHIASSSTCLSFFGFCAPGAKYAIGGLDRTGERLLGFAAPFHKAGINRVRAGPRTHPVAGSMRLRQSFGAASITRPEPRSALRLKSSSPSPRSAPAALNSARALSASRITTPCGSPNALSSSGSPRPRDAGGWTRLFTDRRCDDRNFAVTDPRSRRRSWRDHEIAHLRGTGDPQE